MPFAYNENVALYYQEQGEGEPLVLSSGLGGVRSYWAPQIQELSRRFRVITYDHAGSGQSTRSVGPRSIDAFAKDIEAVITASGAQSAHIMGHAVGGMMGLQLAMTVPDRVRSLIVVNGWGAPDPHIRRCFSVRRNLLVHSGRAAYVEAQPLFLYPAPWISASDAQLRAAARHAPEHMPDTEDLLDRIDRFEAFDPADQALANVSCPVMCLSTRDDMLVPWQAGEALSNRLPKASFVLLPHGGHASSQTDAPAFAEAVRSFYHTQATCEQEYSL
ncbi:pyrimidine utilization protein D [Sagittula sp. SSi028]|uniref:pyrimidine utilization protein D n=1 Tax=Sagittula sp. SSi028 TaxID=3400636 RepID=UPI003AF4911A